MIVLGEQEPKDALVDPSGPAGESTVQQRGARVFEPSNGVHNPLAALDLLLVKLRKTSISLPSIGRSAPPAPNSWRMSWWLRGGLGDADYSEASSHKRYLPTVEGGMHTVGFMFRKVTEGALT